MKKQINEFLVIEVYMIILAIVWMLINSVRFSLFPMYLIGGTITVIFSMIIAYSIIEFIEKGGSK